MWYVKDETGKVYFKSSDVRKAQAYAVLYNKTHKLPFTKVKFDDYNEYFGITLVSQKWDINYNIFNSKIIQSFLYEEKKSPFNKNYNKQHKKYIETKQEKLTQLLKKYHLWSYNEHGRKACSFDF